MGKIIDIGLRVIFSLILLLPILGLTGIFPKPTSDLYNTQQAFAFIEILNSAIYILYMMAVVHLIAIFCLWKAVGSSAEKIRLEQAGFIPS